MCAYLCIYTDRCLYKLQRAREEQGRKLVIVVASEEKNWDSGGPRNKETCLYRVWVVDTCVNLPKCNFKKSKRASHSSAWRGEWSPVQTLMSRVKKSSAVSFLSKCFSLNAVHQQLGGEPLYISLRTPRSSHSRAISAHMASFH